MTRPIDEDADDEDLYQWFIAALADEYGSAVETAHNVIEVRDTVYGDTDRRPHELHISREQLRSVAWSQVRPYADSLADASVPSTSPVYAGLTEYLFETVDTLDSGNRFSRYYVFDGSGGMRRSVRPEDPG